MLYQLNFKVFKVVARCREPQLQVDENYSYLCNFQNKYLQILMFKHTFYPNSCNLIC